jgi:hypothetical protein
MARVFIFIVMSGVVGCASFANDGFRERLQHGCTDEFECMRLVSQATDRDRTCRKSPVRSCDETAADLGAATRMEDEQRRRAAQKHLRDYQREQRVRDEEEREERAAREAKYEAEERERNEELQAAQYVEKRRQERLHLAAHDPEYVIPILSMRICETLDELQKLRRDLAEENEIERRSGVRDLGNRRDIAESQIDAEQRLRDTRSRLHAMGSRPLPCGGAEHKHIAQCVQGESQASCEDVRMLVDLVHSNIEI